MSGGGVVPEMRVRPAVVIALVFAGSAAVAGVLVSLDASSDDGPDGASSVSSGNDAPSDGDLGTTATSAPALPPPRAVPSAEASSAASASTDPSIEPDAARDARDGPCQREMVLVDGAYCPFAAHRCKKERKSRQRDAPVCELYDNAVLCEGALDPLRYCIDRYEYPNRVGALPATLVSFEEAERACAAEDKRLCTLREWTFACEGEAVLPYPVGLERKASLCNWDAGPDAHVTPSRGPHVAGLLEKADRRLPAGERSTCLSPFGVADLGGNVAEWVVEPTQSKKRDPFASVIAGGGWGPGPAACRTRDDAHPPPHRAAMVGFRCCSDAWNDGSTPRRQRRAKPRTGFAPILSPAGLP